MPGKHDFGAGGQVGQYAPGSHEMRAWDEGWVARFNSELITANPFTQTVRPNEYAAWNAGWNEADASDENSPRRMPYPYGSPP